MSAPLARPLVKPLAGPLTGRSEGSLYAPDRTVTVAAAATDLLRGEALVAAYTTAKAITGLSATKRARVLIPDGAYKLAATLTLDTDFVDLSAVVPAMGTRLPTDHDSLLYYPLGEPGGVDLDQYRPPPVAVYSETPGTVILQTATDIRLTGFGIAQLAIFEPFFISSMPTYNEAHMFKLGDIDNDPSIYRKMYFWSRAIDDFTWPVSAHRDFAGTWVDCVANSFSFRPGYRGATITPNSGASEFRAKMYSCIAGAKSFAGDYYAGSTSAVVKGALFQSCAATGTTNEVGEITPCVPGYGSFAGCAIFSMEVDADSQFIDCVAGPNSFGIGAEINGRFIRCTGGANCFGSSVSINDAPHPAQFIGYAEDCTAGEDSFGGRSAATDPYAADCYLGGTLVRCTATGATRPRNLVGATITDSRLTTTANNIDGLKLLDSGSVLTGCEIIVVQGGTGIPINATSAMSVTASTCDMNNATNDPDGLGANVTNLAATPNNTVSDLIE